MVLETKLKSFLTTTQWLQLEAQDLFNLYWAEVSPDSVFTALSSGDAATKSTKLTKSEVTTALVFIEQLDRFFTNQSLTQGTYLASINAVIHGNDEKATAISTAIENFGERAVELLQSVLELFKNAKDILDIYFDSEISAAIDELSGVNIPFYEFSKNDFTLAINLVSGFKKIVNNEDLTGVQGDYSSTVALWRRYL